ncbi:glycoside hydrolase family protein [Photobacterium indicum]|nr:hypothetical protein [Photobacterium indicum]
MDKGGVVKFVLSLSGIEHIIRYEISSPAYYETKLKSPTWPGGDSGVTIGIGYDLGYVTPDKFRFDWQTELSASSLDRLTKVCGKKKGRAKRTLSRLSHIQISYHAAHNVFIETSIPAYCQRAQRAFPGLAQLQPDAQVALLSLVYNRGSSMKGDSRREMRAIRDAVTVKDYATIADQIEKMKRLWAGRGLDGLLSRRDHEAELVRNCNRVYSPDELVCV